MLFKNFFFFPKFAKHSRASVAMFFVSTKRVDKEQILKDLPNHIADTFGKKVWLQIISHTVLTFAIFLRNEVINFYDTMKTLLRSSSR